MVEPWNTNNKTLRNGYTSSVIIHSGYALVRLLRQTYNRRRALLFVFHGSNMYYFLIEIYRGIEIYKDTDINPEHFFFMHGGIFMPPKPKVGGPYRNHFVCLSVRPSVCLSVTHVWHILWLKLLIHYSRDFNQSIDVYFHWCLVV